MCILIRYNFSFLLLFRVPPLFEQLDAEGRLLTRKWHLYDGQHVVYRPARLEPQVLQQEMITAYKKFYSFRNMFQNVALTGWNSSLFRGGVGWWLSRHLKTGPSVLQGVGPLLETGCG